MGVALPAAALPVPAEVDGDHVVLLGEERRDVRPPLGVGGAAVDEDEARIVPLAPLDEVDRRPLDVDGALAPIGGEGPGEPLRRHGASSCGQARANAVASTPSG